ncbi:daunorubicin C-13 ketoreductase [Asanoa ishikariensis]|uniref:NAD(P)-dependent dehydrogenase, short-chain alcohol dehydrogenase family n=1 Tax=Asanoa ishikariensis TaxID=137265 RepID=A0A1H3TJ96_9ACTN|nr:SDR family NAD(P)-dependent oxidoreductase [Asanoa ishikariensis]GIF62317.1 daunorubicin C-13 ketoreductase [Asanoa ishikariensis]SDZ50324.1 NAD(P)-dependent dehydrogenase, short-chain alcohol dehydrogenase family [Asanoa ishikariensis]
MDLSDRTVVLTGATDGIGRATAVRLAGRVGHLVLHGPQPRAELAGFVESLPGHVTYLPADFGHLGQIAQLAADIREATERVDLLVNNAARPGAPRRELSVDGIEATLQINYLSTVVLSTSLRDRVGRIINMASATHATEHLDLNDLELAHGGYAAVTAYARSKLAIVTYTCWLAARLDPPTEAAAMHPGVIASSLLASMFAIEGQPPERGADNLLHVATLPSEINGRYFEERTPSRPNPEAEDPAVQDGLLDRTAELLAPIGVDPRHR